MEIELRDLRYFLAVAQQESITKAAEYLFIAQPSLSRRMQKLESELNRLLFVRGSRKVTLTQAGELLKKRAEEMLQLYEKTQAELLADGESLSGDVYIGGGESCGVRIVARAAKQIQSKYPEVKFHFFSGDTHDVKDKLDKGLIDFGVFVEPSDLTEYDYIRLPAEDTWGVLMPKSSILAQKESVTANDLKGLPLICSRHSIVQKALDEWFSASDCKPAVNVTYNLIYNASLMVEEGMGYAIGLDRLINTTGSDLCFRPLSPRLTARLVVAWKKHQVMSKASGAFLNALKKASLTAGQPKVLDYLKDHDGAGQKEIAAACHIEPATLTSVLNRMEEKGMIERRMRNGNRRSLYVFLTEKGKELSDVVEREFDRAEEQALAGFSPEEREECRRMLRRICENLTENVKE